MVGDLAGEQVAEPGRAGVDDRCERLAAAVASQVAQHGQAGVARVASGVVQRLLTTRARCAGGGRLRVRSMSSISDEVKSADQLVDIGMERFPAEPRQVEQEPRAASTTAPAHSACDAPTAMAGVTPRRCAAANSASRVATSKMCQGRVLRCGSACSAGGTSGSAGGSGRSGIRSAHHCRSSLRRSAAPRLSAAARYCAVGVARARAGPRRRRTPPGRP